jgi:hypothetical protein
MEFDFDTFQITNMIQAELFLKWMSDKGMVCFNKDGIPMNHKWIKDDDRLKMAQMLWKEVKEIVKKKESCESATDSQLGENMSEQEWKSKCFSYQELVEKQAREIESLRKKNEILEGTLDNIKMTTSNVLNETKIVNENS